MIEISVSHRFPRLTQVYFTAEHAKSAEGRSQETEDGKQRTEDRGRRTEDRGQKSGDRII